MTFSMKNALTPSSPAFDDAFQPACAALEPLLKAARKAQMSRTPKDIKALVSAFTQAASTLIDLKMYDDFFAARAMWLVDMDVAIPDHLTVNDMVSSDCFMVHDCHATHSKR